MVELRPSDGLLEQVAAYTAEAVSAVTLDDLSSPTPCAQWDLLALMLHLNKSLGTLIGMLEGSCPDLAGLRLRDAGDQSPISDLFVDDDDIGALLAAALRYRTERLVRLHDAVRHGNGPDMVLVDGIPMPHEAVVAAGAVEIAVHSWDIATACGRTLPIPDRPAMELLDVSAVIVDGAGRAGLFASAVAAPPHARPGDRLIALLGRKPL